MSAEGPESIPTSADPRSKRPTKKRALTPVSAQAASVDALFAKPDQEIRLPSSSTALAQAGRGRGRALPPEIVTNVPGSSAGAGSGEFHVYKAARRREYDRLKEMDDDVRREKEQAEFFKERQGKLNKDEEKTRKNREKREKARARKGKKGNGSSNEGKKETDEGAANSVIKPTVDTNSHTDGNGRSQKQDAADGKDNATTDPASSAGPAAAGLVIHDDD